MIRIFFATLALVLPLAAQPNIIFVLCDDLGYGDLGVLHQNERRANGLPAFDTPRLDTMAAEGAILTRHYVPAPVCAPSRASLLLGVHQGHANVRNNQFDKELENNHTLGTVLKSAGYTTAAIGKWGLQGGPEKAGDPNSPSFPTKRGFDFFFGYIDHSAGHRH
ncbi:MAG: sulfatase-like hydrolase/transferase [Luteolibacter sp.]